MKIAGDQRGAIMVMGVFMAALMIGFIYYVKGIGEAIVFRERMQDAADSGAFAAATVHARGMNLIALINISMVAVMAVVTAIRLIAVIAGIAAALSGLSHPGDIPGLRAILEKSRDHLAEDIRPLFGILRAGNTAANAVATAIPAAAEARAIEAAGGAFRPPVETAFAYPSFRRLPIESSTLNELADRAGTAAMPLSLRPFPPFQRAQDYIYEIRGLEALTGDSIEEARALLRRIDDPSSLEGMVPQQLLAGAALGGERFQVGVLTGGTFDFALSERGVEVATWGQSELNQEAQRRLQTLASISLAGGEFFYEGPGGRDEALWNQSWRARLRRLRLGDPVGYPCREPSAPCDALDEMFRRRLQEAVVH
jgi:hypothetical protein